MFGLVCCTMAMAGPSEESAWALERHLDPAVAGQSPSERLYRRLDEGTDGRVRGRWRQRRDGPFLLWELEDDTVVRMQRRQRGRITEDRRFDATGGPLTTLETPASGLQRIVVHTVPERELVLSGWAEHEIPGGSVVAPVKGLPRDEGGLRFLILGGELDIWHEQEASDVFSAEFLTGLLSGCGCTLVDAAPTWVDGEPAVRYRLEVPGPATADLVDLWAVPNEVGGGLWFASYRVPSPTEPTLAMAPGRALISMIELDALADLQVPAPAAATDEP
ncbi:MAG: hypothetical protein KTR31_16575 [Myxococcales bacterium]|nr:hypothetical protein [Myxococcales bacterium]